jgi:flagellar basal-body rod protein FlgC
MGLLSVLDISGAALDVQRSRLEVATTNLANAQTTSPATGTAYQPLEVIVRSVVPNPMDPLTADGLPRPVVAAVEPMNVTPRRMYDPGHPDADAQGFVTYPGVDPVGTMLDLLTISRSYEANLKAFDITRSLLQKTIDLENQR